LAIDDIISTNTKPRREGTGSRRSATRAIAAGAVALGAGVIAVLLLVSYMDRRNLKGSLTPVVVATMDLPMATVLRAEHLTVAAWPRGVQPAGTFQDPKELVGRVLLSKVFKTELLLGAKVARREAGSGLAALIPENMRAVAVRVDDVVGVAGFIHPEDRVDVIVTLRPEHGGETTSKVILQNVRVLAVGQELQEEDRKRSKSIEVTVATLLVNTEQSEKLALSAAQGKLLLSLRSGTDQNEVPTAGVGPTALLAGGPPLHAVEPPKPKADEPAPVRVWRRVERPIPTAQAPVLPAERKEVVEILRGDRFEQRKFEGKEAQ
jgi:pilus assembly protein CpaB